VKMIKLKDVLKIEAFSIWILLQIEIICVLIKLIFQELTDTICHQRLRFVKL